LDARLNGLEDPGRERQWIRVMTLYSCGNIARAGAGGIRCLVAPGFTPYAWRSSWIEDAGFILGGTASIGVEVSPTGEKNGLNCGFGEYSAAIIGGDTTKGRSFPSTISLVEGITYNSHAHFWCCTPFS
jgi:hypothetical protein